MAKISIRISATAMSRNRRVRTTGHSKGSRWNAETGCLCASGPSGCGKTTLLSLISGLLRPTEGRIFFDDRDVTEAIPEKRNIAQVFQFPVIYDTMSIHDNQLFPAQPGNRGPEVKPGEKLPDCSNSIRSSIGARPA